MSLPAFDFSQTTDYQGFVQRNLNICLIVFSTVFVFARLYVRKFMAKGFGLDDGITVVAYMLLVAFSALEVRTVGLGSGAHIDEIPEAYIPPFFEAMTTQHLMYFWAVGLMRLTIIAFLLRLSQDRLYRILTYTVGGVVIVQTISCFLFRLLECKVVSDVFKPPGTGDCISKNSEAIMMWTHAGVGIAVDVCLFGLPIWIVRNKMMNAAKAARISLIFCVGIFATVTGIVRLAIMTRTNFAIDTTFKMATIAFWTDLEGHVGLWCACFPTLQPLVRLVSFKCGFRSKLESTAKYGGTPSGNNLSYGKSGNRAAARPGSAFYNRSKNGYLRNGSGSDGIYDNSSDSNSQRGIVAEAHASTNLEMFHFDDSLPKNTIQRKTEVRIQVDSDTSHDKAADEGPDPKLYH